MSEAERQAHADGEFDEAAVMRRRSVKQTPALDLAAIMAEIDSASSKGGRDYKIDRLEEHWSTIRAILGRRVELEAALMGWHRPKAPSGEPCRCVGCEDISRARDQVLARSAEEVGNERG